jgi:hypothetical protein
MEPHSLLCSQEPASLWPFTDRHLHIISLINFYINLPPIFRSSVSHWFPTKSSFLCPTCLAGEWSTGTDLLSTGRMSNSFPKYSINSSKLLIIFSHHPPPPPKKMATYLSYIVCFAGSSIFSPWKTTCSEFKHITYKQYSYQNYGKEGEVKSYSSIMKLLERSFVQFYMGYTVTWLRHYATGREVTSSSPDVIGFFT